MSKVEYVLLKPGYDLRFRLNFGDTVRLKVIKGSVWLFGWNLPLNADLVFRDESFTISTDVPSRIMLTNSSAPYYSALSQIPKIVLERQCRREVILIAGTKSSGKTTLARWILNTRFGQGVKSFYINADTYQAVFGCNGCIGVADIDRQITNEGFQLIDPLLFYFGHSEIKQSRQELFTGQLVQVHNAVESRLETYGKPENVCIVIDFPAIRDANMNDALKEVMSIFDITHFVTLGDDNLQELVPKTSEIRVVKSSVLVGSVYINENIKSKLINKTITQYFYGTPEHPLKPTTTTIPRSEFKAYSLGTLNYISSIMLPSGADSPDPKILNAIGITPMLNKRMLAVIPQVAQQDAWKMNVIGFNCLISVDESSETITILTPSEVPPPPSYLVAGTIEYSDVQ